MRAKALLVFCRANRIHQLLGNFSHYMLYECDVFGFLVQQYIYASHDTLVGEYVCMCRL